MKEGLKKRLLTISITPIQNAKPYRLLASSDKINSTVVFLKKPIAQPWKDKESITKAAFDLDITSGYEHHFLKSWGLKQGFFSLISFNVLKWVWKNDIVVIHGHNHLTFWITMFGAKLFGKKLIQTTDATYMEATAESKGWRMKIKPVFLRWLYNSFVDGVFVTSTASKIFLESVGVNVKKIQVIPYAVDDELIISLSKASDPVTLRKRFDIHANDTVFVFCAKFIPRKRANDAIEALARVPNLEGAKLIMIGEGPLAASLKDRAKELGLQNRIIFPGLVKYSMLPAYYTAADILVFCSEHEPYGLPVNEAMLCERPVIVSDRIGSRLDLVTEGETGWIYPCGNIDLLAEKMRLVMEMKKQGTLEKIGVQSRQRMNSWSSETNVQRQLEYFQKNGWVS